MFTIVIFHCEPTSFILQLFYYVQLRYYIILVRIKKIVGPQSSESVDGLPKLKFSIGLK